MFLDQDRDPPGVGAGRSFTGTDISSDKTVRSTHGVNCTGSCMADYVRKGLSRGRCLSSTTSLEAGLPPYEPRGCQRGISFRVSLQSLAREISVHPRRAARFGRRRANRSVAAGRLVKPCRAGAGRKPAAGGFTDWDTAHRIIAAANIYDQIRPGPIAISRRSRRCP